MVVTDMQDVHLGGTEEIRQKGFSGAVHLLEQMRPVAYAENVFFLHFRHINSLIYDSIISDAENTGLQ